MAASKKKASKKTAANNAAASESKADKFKRLAAMRTIKGINAMRGLRKLSNRNNYEYTPEQVEKIITALKTELEAVHDAFTKTGSKSEDAFTL